MQKKVLLSSILVIALCFSVIAGSTYALFTDETEQTIAVTAGKIDIAADLELYKTWSAVGDLGGALVDENGNTYKYEAQPDYTFLNGGSAKLATTGIEIDKITPGDRLGFKIQCANESDIDIQYRYVIEAPKDVLAYGLIYTVAGNEVNPYMESYTSPWFTLAAETAMPEVYVTVELPIDAGNEFQAQNTTINVRVEAVQGNAVVDANQTPVITYYPVQVANATDLADALAQVKNGGNIQLNSDLGAITINEDLKNVTIDAHGNDATIKFTGALENVVVKGIDSDTYTGICVDASAATGNLTIQDCVLDCGAGTSNMAVMPGAGVDITIDGCTIANTAGADAKGYGIYGFSGADVIITNTVFEGFEKSWAYQINGTQKGVLVIENCEFINCQNGLVKTGVGDGVQSGSVEGDFIFRNNKITNCSLKTPIDHEWFEIKYMIRVVLDGNTKDGAAWTPADSEVKFTKI